MQSNIVFFDEKCPFCHRAVRQIVKLDAAKQFHFAPFRGETAQRILTGPQTMLQQGNSIVFAESCDSTSRQFWIRGHAMLRIYWLIGKNWSVLGALSFLPQAVSDFFYNRLYAHRHQFTLEIPEAPHPMDRFLP